MKTVTASLCLILVFVVGCSSPAGQDQQAAGLAGSPQDHPKIDPALLSDAPLERQAAFGKLEEGYDDAVDTLLAILERDDLDLSYTGPISRSIEALGKLRATKAVRPLAERLLYAPRRWEVSENIPAEAYHVAAVALRNIGQPAIPEMVKIIKAPQSEEGERQLAAWVIMEIEGEDQVDHRFRRLIEKSHDERSKMRLEDVMHFIESYEPSFERFRFHFVSPAAKGTPEQHRQVKQRAQALHAADEAKRLEMLTTYILEDYGGPAGTDRLAAALADPASEEAVRAVAELLKADDDPVSFRGRYALALLALAYSRTDSDAVGDVVREAFDRQCALVLNSELHVKVRSGVWGRLTSALAGYGSPGLLTETFWKTLEDQDWRGGDVMRALACGEILTRLKACQETPVWHDQTARERITEMIDQVELLITYPQIRELWPTLDSTMLSHLIDQPPERRGAYIQRRLDERERTRPRTTTRQVFLGEIKDRQYQWLNAYREFPQDKKGVDVPHLAAQFYEVAQLVLRDYRLPTAEFVETHIKCVPHTEFGDRTLREDIAFLRYRVEQTDIMVVQTRGPHGRCAVFMCPANVDFARTTCEPVFHTGLKGAQLHVFQEGALCLLWDVAEAYQTMHTGAVPAVGCYSDTWFSTLRGAKEETQNQDGPGPPESSDGPSEEPALEQE